ncbi:BREX-1 system adenine-specific DNA-methyltransferase PglX [Salicibibacter kimchii]|uniref:site-specific DNA-methyltransferase (adenine-specific) n=1 Tax=Salicibibacter kimchii TaxID=2099786 RepID=A0A345BXB5_9BACI|nr:BREX-1 system adenine-specific DNA-methyltransferase PglX [Salicibibacter kimchii]AXF55596.1 BREX-1 system adenine-specific DNA-methyltransferase PglX [Salicibibacter kimchii]
MDKKALRKFAIEARRKLTKAVIQKAYQFGVTEDKIEGTPLTDGMLVNGVPYGAEHKRQYDKLIRRINQEGYERVIEEVTYTWFNRLIALRFMEVNDYLPIRKRFLSSEQPGKVEPDAVSDAHKLIEDLELDADTVYQLQDKNKADELFKYLLVKQSNLLGKRIPNVFDEIEGEVELLCPDFLLQEGSVLDDMLKIVHEDDWKQVEIVGWLYQFYIEEEKDAVFAQARSKKISKQQLPAATQFFTPDWIVQYMVDNSLGQWWIEHKKDDSFAKKLNYYLEPAEQTEDIQRQMEELSGGKKALEDIKIMDPAAGSGHILVYAFDVLYAMYEESGYSAREIPTLILRHNLYGLDVDKRAVQLATFALIMKAREKDRRFLRTNKNLDIHVMDFEDSNILTDEDIEMFALDSGLNEKLLELRRLFVDAKLYGSLIEVPDFDWDALFALDRRWDDRESNLLEYEFKAYKRPVITKMIKQGLFLEKGKYDFAITNPPYMGRGSMHADMSNYVKERYPDSKADLYAMFMEVNQRLVKEAGFIGMINMHSWMFLSTMEKLRGKIITTNQIYSMVHLGTRAFAEIGGEVVQTTSFILRNTIVNGFDSKFSRLVDIKNADDKKYYLIDSNKHYVIPQIGFRDISGSPIAYWATDQVRKIFRESSKLADLAEPRVGLQTGNNDRFLRLWHEVDVNKIGFGMNSRTEAENSNMKWFPYNKGGSYRKWYGNMDYVVNWENDGQEIRNFTDDSGKQRSVVRNPSYYFQEGITWSDVTSGGISMRYRPQGSIHDVTGMTMFMQDLEINNLLGLLNSKVIFELIQLINPSMHFQIGNVRNLPIKVKRNEGKNLIEQNIYISKNDWDSFETSWDFQQHPLYNLMEEANRIADVYKVWAIKTNERFQQLKSNEEEINRLYIKEYELEEEITPEVVDKEVTIERADLDRDIRSFLSYCIGTIFGRYSLDTPGLAYAGGEWNASQYETVIPEADNIIPITNDLYFENDIVTRVAEVVEKVYGTDTLEENLEFIADALERKGSETARERIRRYFVKEFYKDHLKTYQKRPIYWMFSSGRQNGFQALMYLHRYDQDTIARVRTDYLHLLQRKMEDEVSRLDETINSEAGTREKAQARKRREKLSKELTEMRAYDEIISHQANRRIELDLDDGVKINYAKLQDLALEEGEQQGKDQLLLKKL